MSGNCVGCPSASMTLYMGLEQALRDEVPGLRRNSWSSETWASAPFTIDEVVVGRSPRMRAVFDFVRVIADSDSSVLVTGETGTGKEMIANLIHQSSAPRHPFVPVSCAILSETLIESELFGHERGAFTGAIKDRPGRFELAQGGTIFLDDVDDVPMSMQVKLLRVLQNRTIERLGGTRTIPIDVRVITGTKRDLQQMVAEGKFRDDLFYRLNVIPITLPPLRERREDIPLLMDHFLKRFYQRHDQPPQPLSPGVLQAFMRYPWPGNVRELENACERIAQTCTCDTVRDRLCAGQRALSPCAGDHEPIIETHDHPSSISLDDRLREVEQAHQLGAEGQPATSRRLPSCCISSDRPWATASRSWGCPISPATIRAPALTDGRASACRRTVTGFRRTPVSPHAQTSMFLNEFAWRRLFGRWHPLCFLTDQSGRVAPPS